ncbi:MAG: nucleoside hydrolase [Flavobacteriales bacterium]|nr:nucleoside hydrolase [Flavobacteriales bacterium]
MSSDNWSVEGITTVAGNIKVSQCAQNANKIVRLCDKDIPICVGAKKPLKRENHTLEEVFGNTGLPGIEYLEFMYSDYQENPPAVDFIKNRLESDKSNHYAICATGPLTNLAELITQYPESASRIKALIIMGGCYFPEPIRMEMGNFLAPGASVKSEFNFAIDPEAASIVLNSNIKNITLIGLNLTRKILYNEVWSRKFKNIGNKVASATADILDAVSDSHQRDLGHLRSSEEDPVRAIHDAINVVYMEKPELFITGKYFVKVDKDNNTNSPGYCSVSEKPKAGFSKKPVTIVLDGDCDAIFNHICRCLSRYSHLKGVSNEKN